MADALWEQLKEIHEKERQDLEAEKAALEKEKATMENVHAEPSEILEINVGGEIIQSHRRTLCLVPESMFAHLFSGRWDDSWSRDTQGRLFLDQDPELIRLIINYLRIKQIEDPEAPLGPPTIPREKKNEFYCLVRYFGLDTFFFGTPNDFIANLNLAQTNGKITVLSHDPAGLKLKYNGNGHSFVACQPSLSSEMVSFWKITIDALSPQGWLFLGVIGDPHGVVGQSSYSYKSSYGWARSGQVYYNGKEHPTLGGWTTFQHGEVLFFCFSGSKLSMFSVLKDKVFTMDVKGLANAFLHFNFSSHGTQISISALNEEEEILLVTKIRED